MVIENLHCATNTSIRLRYFSSWWFQVMWDPHWYTHTHHTPPKCLGCWIASYAWWNDFLCSLEAPYHFWSLLIILSAMINHCQPLLINHQPIISQALFINHCSSTIVHQLVQLLVINQSTIVHQPLFITKLSYSPLSSAGSSIRFTEIHTEWRQAGHGSGRDLSVGRMEFHAVWNPPCIVVPLELYHYIGLFILIGSIYKQLPINIYIVDNS